LFEGLYIYDHWDWTQQYPVIRLDFGEINNETPGSLQQDVEQVILSMAERYGITLTRESAGSFAELIQKLHQSTGRRVVVLVDEYDKPITDHLSDMQTANANRNVLHDFYQVLKAADEHLRFVFLTGVSKFAGVSIFSALNNLNDITLDDEYASICGYTQEELESYFPEYLDNAAAHIGMEREELLEAIRFHYNGYSWNGKTPVYNPFSTLLFFDKRVFDNYWFSTGTPTFLIELLKEHNELERVLKPITVPSSSFSSYDPARISEVPLLFQTGYLTVKDRELVQGVPKYTLGIPNSEVRESLLENLLNAYSAYPIDRMEELRNDMRRQVCEGDAEGLAQSLRRLLANIPYSLHVAQEAYYHSLLLTWMTMLGFDIRGEVMTNLGRIDAVWHQPGLTVVAEIKYHAKTGISGQLRSAMTQIRKQRYYEPYLDGRKIILLAVAFMGREVGCRMEKMGSSK
jgi:hypothetical protein